MTDRTKDEEAPELRTRDEILERYELMIDRMWEHGELTPEWAEQVNRALEGILAVLESPAELG